MTQTVNIEDTAKLTPARTKPTSMEERENQIDESTNASSNDTKTTSAQSKLSPPGDTASKAHGHSNAPVSTSHAPTSASRSAPKSASTLDDANEELSQLIIAGKLASDDVRFLKAALKEHVSLKEKVEKLKSLLGRSAKAQREAKVDSEASQKRLVQALREIDRLTKKLDKLQTRPTHLDLLMDFETNFDKALLSVGQPGGQETSATPNVKPKNNARNETSDVDAMDAMLMQELGEARSRIEKLEILNNAMMSRSTQLEETTKTLQRERDDARNSAQRLQMELRMAKLEAEQAHRAMMDKVASLEEMQMEIDLVTKASTKASARAAKGEEAAMSLKTEKQHIQQLESQVQALKEWALASAEAKQLMQERCKILEGKLKVEQGRSIADPMENDGSPEKFLFTKKGSMVIGAGDVGSVVLSLGEHASTVDARFVIIRWKFDSSPSDLTIGFNILKGNCKTSSEIARAVYLVKDRVITGGAGGETEGAFTYDAACTILWSNVKSWIRPRTVKYTVDVVALR